MATTAGRLRSRRPTGRISATAGVQPYQRSKTIAERESWDFMAREGDGLQLAVVNPVGVMGQVLGPDYSTSIQLIKRLLDGAMPGCPDLWFGVVDVRDVAGIHLKAMTDPAATSARDLTAPGPDDRSPLPWLGRSATILAEVICAVHSATWTIWGAGRQVAATTWGGVIGTTRVRCSVATPEVRAAPERPSAGGEQLGGAGATVPAVRAKRGT